MKYKHRPRIQSNPVYLVGGNPGHRADGRQQIVLRVRTPAEERRYAEFKAETLLGAQPSATEEESPNPGAPE